MSVIVVVNGLILNPITFFDYRNIHYSLVKELYMTPIKQTGNQLSFYMVERKNGDDEIRTHDPRLARAVLSQLSYVPEIIDNR